MGFETVEDKGENIYIYMFLIEDSNLRTPFLIDEKRIAAEDKGSAN